MSEESDGSVGRYVRERWGTAEPSRPRRRARRAGDPDVDPGAEPDASPSPSGATATGTRTPPGGIAWGSEVPDADDEMVSEIDPATPPHGIDLSALRTSQATDAPEEPRTPSQRTPEPAVPDADRQVTENRAGADRAGANPAAADRTAADRAAADRAAADRAGADRVAADRTGADRTAADRTAADAEAGSTARPRPDTAEQPRTGTARPQRVRPSAGRTDRPVPPAPRSRPAAERVEGDVRAHRAPADRPAAATGDDADRPAARAADAGTPTGGSRSAEPPARERGASADALPPPLVRAPRPRWTAPDAVEAREAQRRRSEGESGVDLASAQLMRSRRRPPKSGWRRFVYVVSRGYVNPGESPADVRRRELTVRVNKPLLSSHKIAMLSLKGGVGKTTITATLGSTFASLRGDRVVAVDANPDRGTLSQKIPLETTATVRHLLRDAQRVRRYTDVRAYTSQGPSRLEVLASEQDPAVSEAFSEDDYRSAVDLLEHFYNLVLTDCGTGLMHSAMYGVLGMADQLVIVSSGSIDGARSASATLDWLDAHGNGDLVRNAVVVINTVHRKSGSGVDLNRVAEHFAGRCRAVVRVPFDGHLEEGAEIDLDRLEGPTREALLELAASVADGFPS